MATQIPEENKGGFVLSPGQATLTEPHPHPPQLCPGQGPAGPLETAYIVLQVAIAAWLGQQQLDDLHVPVLAGTHQGGGALVVLNVDVSPTGQQALHHVYPPMTDGQHEGCLSCLWEEMTADFRSTCWAGSV